jgi:hypothetical protein
VPTETKGWRVSNCGLVWFKYANIHGTIASFPASG